MYIFWVSLQVLLLHLLQTHSVPLCTKHHIPQRTCSMNGSAVMVLSFFFISLPPPPPHHKVRDCIIIEDFLLLVCARQTQRKKTSNIITFLFSSCKAALDFSPVFVFSLGRVQASGSAVSSSSICPLNLHFCLLARSTVMLRNKSKRGQAHFLEPSGSISHLS